MSALAQYPVLYSFSTRRISEVELLRTISHIVWSSAAEQPAVDAITAATLQVPGLSALQLEELDGVKPPSAASAVALITANSQTYGQVRLFFDPHMLQTLESPVRLARFIGQQLGILFHRLDLERERQKLNAAIEAVDRLTKRRKLIHRATGVLAEQRNVSEKEAVTLMVQYARKTRTNLFRIAESLIFGYDCAAFTRPSLRRVPAGQVTTSRPANRPARLARSQGA